MTELTFNPPLGINDLVDLQGPGQMAHVEGFFDAVHLRTIADALDARDKKTVPNAATEVLLELKTRVIADKVKCASTYANNHMLTKAYGRCVMLIDELIVEANGVPPAVAEADNAR